MERSSFVQACWDGDTEAVTAYLSGTDSANIPESELVEALCASIDHGQHDVISILLDHGAPMANRVLTRVCNLGDAKIAELFLDHGWDPNVQFVNGEPGLRATLRHLEVTKLMLDRGVDPNLTGQRGPAALETALVACTEPEVVELLISYGAILRPEFIYNALGPRARASEAMTQYLIKRGIDVNMPSDRWSTPLHFAVNQLSLSKVKLLLDAGANPSAIAHGSDYTGLTPAQLAERKGAVNIRDAIEARMEAAHS